MQTIAPFVPPDELDAELGAVARAPHARPIAALAAVRAALASRKRHQHVLRPARRHSETALDEAVTLEGLHHLFPLGIDAWAHLLGSHRRALERRCGAWWGLPPRIILEMYHVEVVEHLCVAGLARGVAAAAAGHVQLRRVEEAERLAEVRVKCRVSTLRLSHPRT